MSHELFQKSAGLLKVPEDLLQEVSDFVISCHCYKTMKRLENLNKEYKENNISYELKNIF